MATISQSKGNLGLLLVGGALALVVATATNAPDLPALSSAAGDFTTKIEIVQDADPLEVGEPMAAEPVGADSLGPRAGGTYNVPGLGDIVAGQHAEDRHGVEALQARLAIQSGGYARYDCKDGRTRLVKQLAARAFAIVVIESGLEVSSFISERTADAISRLIERDGCLPHSGNPFGGMGALAN